MGADGHVVVVGPSLDMAQQLAELAQVQTARLERRWSRFDPSSDVSALNRSRNVPVPVAPETFDLVAKSLAANALTNGRFDPTLLPTLEAWGYDQTFDEVADSPVGVAKVSPVGTVLDIDLDEATSTVRMNRGVTFDPGAIGKGLAADIVSQHVMSAGAEGVLVSLGGDIRVRGTSPSGEPAWIITIAEPSYSDGVIATVALTDAAIATSTTLRRRWLRNNVECHHLLDPATLAPTDGPVLVSTIASTGWWAEATATALSVNPEPCIANVPSLIVDTNQPSRFGGFGRFELEISK